VPIPESWDNSLTDLQRRIGVRFKDVRHLKCALVHHGVLSGMHLPPHIPVHRLSNRSMEFLGDSVLAMAVASYIFQAQPMHREGKMTRAKDRLVNNQTLSRVCVQDLEMDELVIVDPNISARQKGNTSPMYLKGRVTIEAGSVEALIAAIYLDQVGVVRTCVQGIGGEKPSRGGGSLAKGLARALDFVNRHVLPHAIRYAAREEVWDPALELQKLLQAHRMGHPVYECVAGSLLGLPCWSGL
jgi:dsRNA-specific ribonuclease